MGRKNHGLEVSSCLHGCRSCFPAQLGQRVGAAMDLPRTCHSEGCAVLRTPPGQGCVVCQGMWHLSSKGSLSKEEKSNSRQGLEQRRAHEGE